LLLKLSSIYDLPVNGLRRNEDATPEKAGTTKKYNLRREAVRNIEQ